MDDLDDKSSPPQRGPFSAPIQGPNLKPIDSSPDAYDVRHILYIAAEVAATHSKGVIADFYVQLKGRGKSSKVALTACMRKLIVCLNAMLAKGQTWEAHPA